MTAAAQLTAARRAMNCDFSITLPGSTPRPVDAASAALDEIDRLEALLSAFLPGSELSQANLLASEKPFPLSPEFHALLRSALLLYKETAGAFDPAAGALLRAWGFLHPPRRVPSPSDLHQALQRSGAAHLSLQNNALSFQRPGLELNLGAFGKGYALDRAALLLTRRGARSALLSGGQSSLLALAPPPAEPRGWPVALMDPFDQSRRLATLHLRHSALGTSGAANQFFLHDGRRYGHILDPRSGQPARLCASVTVLAPSAAEADALSTAFYVLGPEAAQPILRRRPELAAIFVLPLAPGRASVRTFGSLDFEPSSERLSA